MLATPTLLLKSYSHNATATKLCEIRLWRRQRLHVQLLLSDLYVYPRNEHITKRTLPAPSSHHTQRTIMEDEKKKSFVRVRKEKLLAFARRNPRMFTWLEKKLAKELEVADEKYKEFNQTPLYKFYSTEAATRVTPSMHYERYPEENKTIQFPDNAVYLVYVVKGNVKVVRKLKKPKGKKKFMRIVTFNAGTYFYKVRGGKSILQSGEENTVILASRTDSMFDVAMRYR